MYYMYYIILCNILYYVIIYYIRFQIRNKLSMQLFRAKFVHWLFQLEASLWYYDIIYYNVHNIISSTNQRAHKQYTLTTACLQRHDRRGGLRANGVFNVVYSILVFSLSLFHSLISFIINMFYFWGTQNKKLALLTEIFRRLACVKNI